MKLDNVQEFFDHNRDELIELTRDLVRISSVNPPGDTREISGFIADLLRSEGVDCEQPAGDELRPGVLVTINSGKKPNLLFHTHLDTATVGDPELWQVDPFGAETRGGRLYGRGASDAKSALAAMVMVVLMWARARCRLVGSLTFNAVADEETGGDLGMAHVVRERLLSPDWAVVGESTANRVAIAERGMLWLEITVRGRSAHASAPWEGVNAVSKMVAVLHHVERELEARFAGRRHPLTPPPSLNIGVIEGGVRANIVPDWCRAVVDRRVLPGESVEEAAAEIEELVGEVVNRDHESSARVDVVLRRGLPLETDRDHPLVVAALDVCRELGIDDLPGGYVQASDGRILTELGIPTIIVGPGRPDVAHRANEYVGVEQLVTAGKLYGMLAVKMVGKD